MPGMSVICWFSVSSSTMRLGAMPSSLSSSRVWPFIKRGSSRQPGVTLGGEGPQAGLAAGVFQIERQTATLRRSKQLVRPLQRTALRAADQGLVTEDRAQPIVDDGLKNGAEQPFRHDPAQLVGLIVDHHYHLAPSVITEQSV